MYAMYSNTFGSGTSPFQIWAAKSSSQRSSQKVVDEGVIVEVVGICRCSYDGNKGSPSLLLPFEFELWFMPTREVKWRGSRLLSALSPLPAGSGDAATTAARLSAALLFGPMLLLLVRRRRRRRFCGPTPPPVPTVLPSLSAFFSAVAFRCLAALA
jgi:hypothetical protein